MSQSSAPSAEAADGVDSVRRFFLDPLSGPQRVAGAARLAAHGPSLIGHLRMLYGDAGDFTDWLTGLFSTLGRLAARRPPPLQALDEARASQPDWFVHQRMVGYSAYVDRFAGTLRGVGERIGYLRELGVGYLHLLPFLRARSGDSDGGFAVASFDEVDPALGSMADLEALTAGLRAAGISLCCDLVLNHVADEHSWARAAMAGDPNARAFFHVFPDQRLPDAYEAHLGQVFPQAAPGNFTYVPGLGWVWTTFYRFQWDLNYAHPPVFAAMAEALLHLANRGVEVFRLDSAPYLWKRLGTSCVNQPEVHRILAALRACTELVAPGVLLKAEAIIPSRQVVDFFGRDETTAERECQLAYHSGLMAASWAGLAEGHAGLLRELIERTPALPAATGWVTYVRCHDEIVWGVLRPQIESGGGDFLRDLGTVAARLEGRQPDGFGRGASFQDDGKDVLHGTNGMAAALVGLADDPRAPADAAALRRFVLLYALAFWTGAVPLIYMGDELGQGNNLDPGDAARVARDGRWLQRPRLSAVALAAREHKGSVAAATFSALRALARARRDPRWPADQPVSCVVSTDPGVLILRRGDRAEGWFNFAARAVVFTPALPGAPSSILFASGAGVDADGVRTLAAWGTVWLMRDHG